MIFGKSEIRLRKKTCKPIYNKKILKPKSGLTVISLQNFMIKKCLKYVLIILA